MNLDTVELINEIMIRPEIWMSKHPANKNKWKTLRKWEEMKNAKFPLYAGNNQISAVDKCLVVSLTLERLARRALSLADNICSVAVRSCWDKMLKHAKVRAGYLA